MRILSKATPNIMKKLGIVKEDSRFCNVVPTGQDEFKVIEGKLRFVFSLRIRTYSCQIWDATGIPCKHVATTISFNRGNLEGYCDTFYNIEKYRLGHREIIHLMPDLDLLETDIGEKCGTTKKKRRGNLVRQLHHNLGRNLLQSGVIYANWKDITKELVREILTNQFLKRRKSKQIWRKWKKSLVLKDSQGLKHLLWSPLKMFRHRKEQKCS